MAGDAHLRILASQAFGIEARAVGIEMPTAERRVTLQAVPLHVARGARLEALSSSLPVTRQEEPTGVVVPGPEGAGAHETCRLVARLAEAADVVALAA